MKQEFEKVINYSKHIGTVLFTRVGEIIANISENLPTLIHRNKAFCAVLIPIIALTATVGLTRVMKAVGNENLNVVGTWVDANLDDGRVTASFFYTDINTPVDPDEYYLQVGDSFTKPAVLFQSTDDLTGKSSLSVIYDHTPTRTGEKITYYYGENEISGTLNSREYFFLALTSIFLEPGGQINGQVYDSFSWVYFPTVQR